jgi:hypothetical protein
MATYWVTRLPRVEVLRPTSEHCFVGFILCRKMKAKSSYYLSLVLEKKGITTVLSWRDGVERGAPSTAIYMEANVSPPGYRHPSTHTYNIQGHCYYPVTRTSSARPPLR